MEEMLSVETAHREPRTFGERVAWKLVRFARFWMDKVTGMEREQRVDKNHPTTAIVAEKPLTEAQWVRNHLLLSSLVLGAQQLTLSSLLDLYSSKALLVCLGSLPAC